MISSTAKLGHVSALFNETCASYLMMASARNFVQGPRIAESLKLACSIDRTAWPLEATP